MTDQTAPVTIPTACRFGYVEHDGDQYCFEHYGWHHYTDRRLRCDEAVKLLDAARPLPLHRTEAGYPNCSTCDGGGCLDCTDPA